MVLGAALLPGACGRHKGAGYFGYALVATAGENSLAVIDLTAFRLLKSIPLGAPPTAVVPASGGDYSYVLTPTTDSVHIVDGNLKIAATHRLRSQVNEIRLTPDGRGLMAAGSRELILIEPDPWRASGHFKLEAEPVDLDISASGYAAVSTGPHGVIELVHLASGNRNRTQLQGAIGAVRFRADGQLLLVANLQDRSIVALDVPSLRVVAELPLAMRPDHLCFYGSGQLFVAGEGLDGVAIVFPYFTLEVEQTVLAGRAPGVMACSDNPAYLFVGSASGSQVCILNVNDRKMIGLVEIGGKPSYIAITPGDQYALVLDAGAGDMAVIHIPAIRIIAKRPETGAALFTMIPVGNKPVHAAVVPRVA
jgi:hypothetical protein